MHCTCLQRNVLRLYSSNFNSKYILTANCSSRFMADKSDGSVGDGRDIPQSSNFLTKAFSALKSSLSVDTYKMVFVVNKSLEMGVGKVATQVAHSAIGIHSLMLQDQKRFGGALKRWFMFGQTKIVLRGNTTEHLFELEKKAIEIGLLTYLVQDAGRTQIAAGSTTVLSIFGRVDLVDNVTGSLRLL